MTLRKPTPIEFVEACRIARPTHHLFGYGSKDLGEMVDVLLKERDELLATLGDLAKIAAYRKGDK